MKWVIPFMAMFGLVACENSREDWCVFGARNAAALESCDRTNSCGEYVGGRDQLAANAAEGKVRCEWKDGK